MTSTTQKLRYMGSGSDLFAIYIRNALLSIVTLGIYSFWGRVNKRKFFCTQTELADDRFAYHGTAQELLRGGLVAFGIFMVLAIVNAVLHLLVAGPAPQLAATPASLIVSIAYLLTLCLLIGIAVNSSRRYRLSRTSWRGVRFSFQGTWRAYLSIVVPGTMLYIVTLSVYRPFFQNNLRKFLGDNSRFGSLAFAYDGEGSDLLGEHLKALALTIPTLGFSWCWYSAYQHRYFWSRTSLGPARFHSTVTGGGIAKLSLGNIAIVLGTLGIGTAWAVTRWHRYAMDNLALVGDIDWKTAEQRAETTSTVGEGVADGLDLNVDLGLSL